MITADTNILNYFNIFNVKTIISKKEIIDSFRVTTVRIWIHFQYILLLRSETSFRII
jgi:hypothetical protein